MAIFRGLLCLYVVLAVVAAAPSSPQDATTAIDWDNDHRDFFRPGSAASIKNFKNKIKHVVWLVMENRSFNNILGGQTLPGLDNPIQTGPFCVPRNLTDASYGNVCAEPRDFDSITEDPGHGVTTFNMQIYGTYLPDDEAIHNGSLTPSMNGFVHEQVRLHGNAANSSYLAKQVMNYYTESQVPVITSIVQNFLTFNDWFGGLPCATNPNRAMLTAGTSQGHGTNDGFAEKHELTVMSVWEKMTELNRTWRGYSDSTIDIDDYAWTYSSGHNTSEYIQDIAAFQRDAALGNLTDLTYVFPTCCDPGTFSMHPTSLVSDGESFLKTIYESLRASPVWNETMFVVTFDESGGFADQKPPPTAPRPDNYSYVELAPNGENYTFLFDRTGVRVPTFIISPWVTPGSIEKLGKTACGVVKPYFATSILRTLGYLWDFKPFNPRVAAAPSFEHLIGTKLSQSPLTLPDPRPFR